MFWQEEITNHGPSGASFYRAVWRFTRTRIIADCLIFTVSCILGFLTPVSILGVEIYNFKINDMIVLIAGMVFSVTVDIHAETIGVCRKP